MLKNSFALLSSGSIVATAIYLIVDFAGRQPF